MTIFNFFFFLKVQFTHIFHLKRKRNSTNTSNFLSLLLGKKSIILGGSKLKFILMYALLSIVCLRTYNWEIDPYAYSFLLIFQEIVPTKLVTNN